jgi:selenophosphate synthetase-related protein
MKDEINKCIEHMLETSPIRRVFWHQDEFVEGLLYGIQQGDDGAVVGDFVYNMEGPYPMKTGQKTGLLHSITDIVGMGAKPLYAFNAMQVDSIAQAKEVCEDLKKQANGIGVPIIGGNTQMENGLVACISFTVVGQLVREPLSDAGCRVGDKILMVGHVMDGTVGERVYRAKTKYATMLEMYEKKIDIHAVKDASRGGWFGNLLEMLVKSKKGVKVTAIPYPSPTRYMGTYMLSVPKKEADKVLATCAKHKCPCIEVGTVMKGLYAKIGQETIVTEAKMRKLIRGMPYRHAKKRKKK